MINKSKYTILVIFVFLIVSCKSVQKGTKSERKTTKTTEYPDQKREDNSALFIDANKERILGNYEEAVKLYNKCVEIDPEDAASYFELAKIHLLFKKYEEALIYAEKSALIDPENVYYQLLYGNLLQSLERYDDAIIVYEGLVENYPDKLDYYNELAMVYLYAGKLNDAIDVYNILEEKVGIREDFSLKKQSIYLQQNKINKAVYEIEKLIEYFPNDAKYYAILAEMCLSNGLDEKARSAYLKIIEIDPENPYVHISLADYYRKRGEEEKAFEELKMGFANPSLSIDSKIQILIRYYTVTEIYSDLKDQAFELSEIMIEAHPENPKAFSMYGDFLFQDKKYEEARDAFRQVIALDSSKYLVWEQLLFTESELNDQDALLKESLKTIELFPEQPLPYLFAGGTYYQKKVWQDCVDILNKGLFYVVSNNLLEVQFYSYLGDAYNQLGDDSKSDEAYDKALMINPDNDYVLNNYAYFLSLRNENLEKAAQMAKRAVELKPNTSSSQDTYGWVLYKMGNYEEARIWIEKAIENDENPSAVILEHLGDVLWQLNEKEKAIEFWQKAKQAGEGSEFLEKKVVDKRLYE